MTKAGEQPTSGPPTTPWVPEDLPVSAQETAGWTYVVLEELIDGLALLRRWPWPVVDALGRVRWLHGTEHQTDSATIDVGLLAAQLYTEANRIDRRPRCGDTFAVPAHAGMKWRGARTQDLRDLFGESGVFDITADAREAVKIAYQASLAAVQPARPDDPSHQRHREVVRARAENPLRPLTVAAPPPRPATRRKAGT